MNGHITPDHADSSEQSRQYMSRVYNDLDRSSHRSSSALDKNPNEMQQAIRPRGKIPNIAIIGAGISGLRCADVLIRSGARVTIYEARDRIGGRVHQVESGGHLMDIGANWIHGSQSNPIADIAERTNTTTYFLEDSEAIIDSRGNRMDNRVASELSEAVWGIIAKALRYSDEHSAEIDKCQSLMDYFQDQVKQVTDDASMQALVLQQAQMWGGYVGDPIERQSLKFFFLEECIDGENAFVAGTYKKILAEIAATALADADIRLNEEVVFFHAHHDPQSTFPATVTIQTRSGTQHTYDEVVLTAPLGWLKRHKYDAFPPDSPLPSRLLQAIDNISYSRLEKVYVTFPMAFWQQDTSTAASHAEDPPNSNISSSSTSSAKSGPSTYPSFTHFSTPDYVPHPPDIPWNQVLVNLAALPGTTSHPTLLFYLYGACGTHLVNLIQDIPVSTSPSSPYHQTLRRFFEPFYSRLPNYDIHSPSCTPSAFLATKWQLDPFAGNGAYTNIQVGLENADKDIEVMREGVGEERRLWLAGEHTAPFIALGTTTGAYWSGEGVARRIVKLYDALELSEAVVGEGVDDEQKKKVPSVVEKRDAANANGLAL